MAQFCAVFFRYAAYTIDQSIDYSQDLKLNPADRNHLFPDLSAGGSDL